MTNATKTYQTVSRVEFASIKKKSKFNYPYEQGLYNLIKCRFCGGLSVHAYQMYPCSQCGESMDDAFVYSGYIQKAGSCVNFYLDRLTEEPLSKSNNQLKLLITLCLDFVKDINAIFK